MSFRNPFRKTEDEIVSLKDGLTRTTEVYLVTKVALDEAVAQIHRQKDHIKELQAGAVVTKVDTFLRELRRDALNESFK